MCFFRPLYFEGGGGYYSLPRTAPSHPDPNNEPIHIHPSRRKQSDRAFRPLGRLFGDSCHVLGGTAPVTCPVNLNSGCDDRVPPDVGLAPSATWRPPPPLHPPCAPRTPPPPPAWAAPLPKPCKKSGRETKKLGRVNFGEISLNFSRLNFLEELRHSLGSNRAKSAQSAFKLTKKLAKILLA